MDIQTKIAVELAKEQDQLIKRQEQLEKLRSLHVQLDREIFALQVRIATLQEVQKMGEVQGEEAKDPPPSA